jgi:hypothetical protein
LLVFWILNGVCHLHGYEDDVGDVEEEDDDDEEEEDNDEEDDVDDDD